MARALNTPPEIGKLYPHTAYSRRPSGFLTVVAGNPVGKAGGKGLPERDCPLELLERIAVGTRPRPRRAKPSIVDKANRPLIKIGVSATTIG